MLHIVDTEPEREAPHQCATPECRSESGHGNTKLFCEPCAAFLGRIREELEGFTFNDASPGFDEAKRGTPACCNPYCFNPRTPPEPFCDECQAAGQVAEEEAA